VDSPLLSHNELPQPATSTQDPTGNYSSLHDGVDETDSGAIKASYKKPDAYSALDTVNLGDGDKASPLIVASSLKSQSGRELGLAYGNVKMHGFLFKKSRFYSRVGRSGAKVWEKFWFILDNDGLRYCPDPRYPDENVHRISLRQSPTIEESKTDNLVFILRGTGLLETYTLRAWTEEIKDEWLKALKHGLEDIRTKDDQEKKEENLEVDESAEASEEAVHLLSFPKNDPWWKKVIRAICYPNFLIFTLTIPDVRAKSFYTIENKVVLAVFGLTASIGYLALISIAVVRSADKFGCLSGLTSEGVGLSLGSIGAALPNLFASVAVAKQGLGNMAISNAFGSCVFDVFIALGIPWVVQTTFITPGKGYYFEAEALNLGVLMLVCVVMIFVALMVRFRLRLNKLVGAILLAGYVLLLTGYLIATHVNL